MKTLIVYSNALLFPEAPNFYSFVAQKRGKKKEYEELRKQYEKKKAEAPALLHDTVMLTLHGLEVNEFKQYIDTYVSKFGEKEISKLEGRAEDIILAGSYPAMVYQALSIGDTVIAVDLLIVESKIQEAKPISYFEKEYVINTLTQFGFQDAPITEANLFGNLGRIIEHLHDTKTTKDEVTIISNGENAKPSENIAAHVISEASLDEIVEEL